jgi:hypothetical protein
MVSKMKNKQWYILHVVRDFGKSFGGNDIKIGHVYNVTYIENTVWFVNDLTGFLTTEVPGYETGFKELEISKVFR